MNNKIIKDAGITLIALVITIIVLLILAGVSIVTLSGPNGIITKSNNAKKENEIASVKEQAKLDITNYVTEQLRRGEDSTVNTPQKVQEILNDANTETKKYYAGFTETGITTPNGYEVPYEELYTTDSNENETSSKTVKDLVAGEKVYYDTGVTNVENNGIVECFVLYDQTYNNENKKNYGIQIITVNSLNTVKLGYEDPTVTEGTTNFEKAKNSFNNAIVTLNKNAEKYLNIKYAIDARCVGSEPDNKNSEATSYFSTSYYEYMKPYNNMFKAADHNSSTDWFQMRKLNIKITPGAQYWLASRDIYTTSSSSKISLSIGTADGLEEIRAICEISSSGDATGKSNSYYLRPVFTLKPNLKITGGDGINTPYTIEL